MVAPDINRRLGNAPLREDIDSFNGFQSIIDYKPLRPEATPEALAQKYATMLAVQQEETIKIAAAKAATDAAREAEWDFHNAVLAMKETVKGQYGSNSNEAQAIGFKKKSERKRPAKKTTP